MSTDQNIVVDRALGSLIGLAIGDALGTTFEGGPRRQPDSRIAMTGSGPYHLEPGQWTDDTAMALCVADSLIANGSAIRHRDLMDRFAGWMTEGQNSCTGDAFDVGVTTRGSISEFIETRNPITGPTGRDGAGNGGIMRLSPAVLANLKDERSAAVAAVEQSRTTHGAPQCLEAAEFMARLLHRLVLRPTAADPQHVSMAGDYVEPEIARLTDMTCRVPNRDGIRSTGYVVHTLEAAIWSFVTTRSFEDALSAAINLGGDTDTIGAVAGQITGAAYGLSAIPREWVDLLAWHDDIIVRGRKLIAMSDAPPRRSMLDRLVDGVRGRR